MTTAMAAEIAEAPAVVERVVGDTDGAIAAAARAIQARSPRWVTLVGRGTSDHAATFGRYLIETMLGWPCGLAAASVTTVYDAPLRWTDGLVIAISQSGQSPDVVAVVDAARAGGATTIVITNDPGSPLGAAAASVIPLRAGTERALAATKTYVASLAALAVLVDRVADGSPYADALARLPDHLETTVVASREWVDHSGVVDDVARSDRAIVTSRGLDLATALEIAIKLQETGGLFVDGRSTADLEHGPIILAASGAPVLVIRPDGAMGRRVDGALERLRAMGARPWIVGGQEAPTSWAALDPGRSIQLPVDLPAPLAPIVRIVPGQLLAERVARARGRDPDHPAGLTKVTRTH